jgi:hypothetical protein
VGGCRTRWGVWSSLRMHGAVEASHPALAWPRLNSQRLLLQDTSLQHCCHALSRGLVSLPACSGSTACGVLGPCRWGSGSWAARRRTRGCGGVAGCRSKHAGGPAVLTALKPMGGMGAADARHTALVCRGPLFPLPQRSTRNNPCHKPTPSHQDDSLVLNHEAGGRHRLRKA